MTALELRRARRTFPGVVALDGVDFDLARGEVHAVVGENGAGKSTLIHLLSGVLQPDSGTLLLKGRPVRLTGPLEARRLGILTVYQEAEFFPTLSVAENMALQSGLPTGRWGLVDWRAVERSARDAVESVGEPIDVGQPAERLSVAARHMIQIAAAVAQRAHVVILDEPTSALSAAESQWLFGQVRQLTAAGAAVIYISHRQDEVLQLADRITVLRDGRKVWTRPVSDVTAESMVEAMVGRAPAASRTAASAAAGPVLLEAAGLEDRDGCFTDVSFALPRGEIVGLYGLIGAGRTELAESLFGLRPLAAGSLTVEGRMAALTKPAQAVAAGIALVPEDRLRQGLFRGLSVRANTVVSTLTQWSRGGVLSSRAAERAASLEIAARLAIKHRAITQPVSQLSGGNQQKVVLGRWLLARPKVLILDDPTRGVDIGAKAEIHRLLRQLADDGCAVLMISNELNEVLELRDKILVLREGVLAGEFDARRADTEQLARAALPGAHHEDRHRTEPTSSDKRNKRTTEQPGQQPRQPSRFRSTWLAHALPASELGLAIVVLALLIWLGMSSENFFTANNLANLFGETAIWTVLGLAAATVIVAGGIDISLGSLLAVSAAVAGLILTTDLSPSLSIPLAIGAALLTGACGGLLNGALALAGRIHPIVVTLGMIYLYRGIAIALLRGRQIHELPPAFGRLAIDPGSGLRGSILIAAMAAAAVHVLLSRTRFGRGLYALGASPMAARLVGVSRTRGWLGAFALGGLLTGVAAVIELASSMQMQAQLARGWELQAIAIAVIGGVSITGGRGGVFGVILAALLLQLVGSSLVRWEIRGSQVDLVIGAMILAAVVLDTLWRRRER